jgi:DeoR/GlpR family transcriptional regulator of sugar metabolism
VVASGAAAAEAAAQVTADLFLMGVTGVRPDTGLTTGDVDEAAMKRTLSRRAAETWVMASEEKIGAASPFRVLGLDEVAGIVSDAAPDHTVLVELERSGVRVLSSE